MAHKKEHGELSRHIHADHKMHASVMKHIDKLEYAIHCLKEHMHKKHDPKKKHHDPKKKHHESPKFKAKTEKVMHEYKEGKLHSGSKKGPEVTNRKQAIAIALSEARKASGIKGKKHIKRVKQ